MNKQEAFNLVSKICADFKGTLNDHQAIQQALTVIQNEMNSVPVKAPETIKPDFDKKEKTETEDSK